MNNINNIRQYLTLWTVLLGNVAGRALREVNNILPINVIECGMQDGMPQLCDGAESYCQDRESATCGMCEDICHGAWELLVQCKTHCMRYLQLEEEKVNRQWIETRLANMTNQLMKIQTAITSNHDVAMKNKNVGSDALQNNNVFIKYGIPLLVMCVVLLILDIGYRIVTDFRKKKRAGTPSSSKSTSVAESLDKSGETVGLLHFNQDNKDVDDQAEKGKEAKNEDPSPVIVVDPSEDTNANQNKASPPEIPPGPQGDIVNETMDETMRKVQPKSDDPNASKEVVPSGRPKENHGVADA